MKKNIFKLVITFLILTNIFACKKEAVDDVDFDVMVDSTTFNLMDTVNFNIKGNPDAIGFFSGELGNNYDYKDSISKEGGTFNLSFTSRAENLGCFTMLDNSSFKILLSNNLEGPFSSNANPNIAASEDSALVNKATWKDVTSRFNIPTSGIINTFYPSNEINISDLITNANYPVNIAFKYAASQTPYTGGANNGITIGTLSLKGSFPDGTTTTFNVDPKGPASKTWKFINADGVDNSWRATSTQLKYTSSSATSDYSEDWAISNGFYPKSAIPDKAKPIKNITQSPLDNYRYKFTKPGNYKVVFIASNNRVDEQKQKMKQLLITIKP